MSGDLIVGGGGSIAVATTTLFSHAQRLEEIERQLEACIRMLDPIDRMVDLAQLTLADAPLSAARAESAIDEARGLLHAASGRSGTLASALRLGANVYGATESSIATLSRTLAGDVGVVLGYLGSTVGLLLLPAIVTAIGGGVTGLAVSNALNPSGTRRAMAVMGTWLGGNRGFLSDPRFIELVRYSVMSADDFGAGAAKLPPAAVRLLGDDGFGILGLDTSAATVVSVAGLAGALRETPVVVKPTSTAIVSPATGFADRADRVPESDARVRIDRYIRTGEPDRFELYLGGTADFSPTASVEPWDLTSNVSAIAGADAGAYRAVVDALASAGVQRDSELVVTGYSQGGLIGSQIAASGDYDVRGLYTLGAPAGQVLVPSNLPWVALEHTDDIVPAVGGTWASSDPVIVRREALADHAVDPELIFPAHQLSTYRETAALVDGADESRLVGAAARFEEVSSGAVRVESTWYTARRSG